MKLLFLFISLLSVNACLAKDNAEPSKLVAEVTKEDAFDNLLEAEKKIIKTYEEAVPSVVNVSNIKVADSFFYGRVEVPQGAGTGYVWNEDGFVVTNFHVVQGGNAFVVTFHNDKKQYKAKVVGVSPRKDIAVLKLEEKPEKLKPIKIGSSKNLHVGQIALALGNPFGLDHSISRGIISALGRKIDGIGGVKIHDMIQTDAAINQGNSGGPLLDSNGAVIGMNTMIFSPSGSSAGLGFAVPIDTIKNIVPQLISHGKVIRPGLGIDILDESLRERYVGETGAAITYIDQEGAAYKAGLKGIEIDRYGNRYLGDVIISIDGKEVNSRDDVYHALDDKKIGDTVEIEYLRDKKRLKAKVKLQQI